MARMDLWIVEGRMGPPAGGTIPFAVRSVECEDQGRMKDSERRLQGKLTVKIPGGAAYCSGPQ